jgi:hypothetical protein
MNCGGAIEKQGRMALPFGAVLSKIRARVRHVHVAVRASQIQNSAKVQAVLARDPLLLEVGHGLSADCVFGPWQRFIEVICVDRRTREHLVAQPFKVLLNDLALPTRTPNVTEEVLVQVVPNGVLMDV